MGGFVVKIIISVRNSFTQILSICLLLVTFFASPLLAQESKPKEPNKQEMAIKRATSGLKAVLAKMGSRGSVGEFYEQLNTGLHPRIQKAFLQGMKGNERKDLRKLELPDMRVDGKRVHISLGKEKFIIEYVLKNGTFVLLNGKKISFQEAETPESLLQRVNEIVKEGIQPKKKRSLAKKFGFILDLFFPQAHACSKKKDECNSCNQTDLVLLMMMMMNYQTDMGDSYSYNDYDPRGYDYFDTPQYYSGHSQGYYYSYPYYPSYPTNYYGGGYQQPYEQTPYGYPSYPGQTPYDYSQGPGYYNQSRSTR